MKGLTNLNTRDTAVVDESFKPLVTAFSPADSSATIKQTAFQNEEISYETNSSANNLAVFSEIYYKDWHAYLDGKAVPFFKANYVLRAMVIPAGKHAVVFKFEPEIYFMSKNVSAVANWLVFILLLAGLFFEWKKRRTDNNIKV